MRLTRPLLTPLPPPLLDSPAIDRVRDNGFERDVIGNPVPHRRASPGTRSVDLGVCERVR